MERSIWFFLALHLTGQVMMAQETTQDIRLISDRLTAGWIAHRFSPDRVEDLLAGLEGDGGWKDIDYTDVSRTHWRGIRVGWRSWPKRMPWRRPPG